MAYKLIKKSDSGIRIGELTTPHGKIETPFFMPVGTVGSVKSVSPDELNNLGAQIVLSNTYHLYLRPGEKLIKSLGGLHEFMKWPKPILTDSGGYQVFSLGDRSGQKDHSLVKITEEGIEFSSHLDGSKHLFTPEKVIDIQLDLGVDILMPLDVCPSGRADTNEIRKSVDLTIAWAKRAKVYFDKKVAKLPVAKRPLLHGIVQGGLDKDLRRYCAEELIKLDFDGYSVGGLAVDLETRDMWDIVKLMGEILPENKQRYLMGVGTPDDIIHATTLGMDMFDCVLPTRLARHSNVYIPKRQKIDMKKYDNFTLVNLLNSKYRTDGGVLDKNCDCPACKGGFSRAYISHLLRSNEILGLRFTTLHNLWQYLDLMRKIRAN
jgi:queuine tRNA-ribosyltransferase